MHQRGTRGEARMTQPENEPWDTALRHQRGDQTIQPPKTTSDFHIILQVEIVAARPHTLGRSYYKPFFGRVRRDQPGTLIPRIRPNHLHTGRDAGSTQGWGAAPEGLFLNPRLTPERCGCRGVKQHLPLNISFGMRRLSWTMVALILVLFTECLLNFPFQAQHNIHFEFGRTSI